MRRAMTWNPRLARHLAGVLLACGLALAAWAPAARSSEGVRAWGSNVYGQCSVPPDLTSVVAIAAGDYHTLALESDGTVRAWGWNNWGQCNVPVDLTGVVAIAGREYSVALRKDGTVRAWGRNDLGQCNVPGDLGTVTAIAAGREHVVALRNDGTVCAWGNNYYGQCSVPAGLTGVVAIAAGAFHTAALRDDGTVRAWGKNHTGECNVPSGLNGVYAIEAAGTFVNGHTVALKKDGVVCAWGDNRYGQCAVPPGLTGVVAISARSNHNVALKSDGTVRAWGYNGNGECDVPGDLGGVTAIEAGYGHTVALYGARPAQEFAIYSVSPSRGPLSGGTPVTITGTGFMSGATVTFGGRAATGVACLSSTRLTCRTPACPTPGPVSVVVRNPSGLTAWLTDGFTYEDAPTGLPLTIGVLTVNGDILTQLGEERFEVSGNVTINGSIWVSQPVICDYEQMRVEFSGELTMLSVLDPDFSEILEGANLYFDANTGVLTAGLPNATARAKVAGCQISFTNFRIGGQGVEFDFKLVVPKLHFMNNAPATVELKQARIDEVAPYFHLLGSFRCQLSDVKLPGTKFGLKRLELEWEPAEKRFFGAAKLQLPGQNSFIGGECEIIDGKLNAIFFSWEGKQQLFVGPLTATGIPDGIWLTAASGGFNHLNDGEPFTLELGKLDPETFFVIEPGVGLCYGLGIGQFSTDLVTLEGAGRWNTNWDMAVGGSVTLAKQICGDLARIADVSMVYVSGDRLLTMRGKMSLLDLCSLSAVAEMCFDAERPYFAAAAKGRVGVPKEHWAAMFIPELTAEAAFYGAAKPVEKYVAGARGTVRIFVLEVRVIQFQYDLLTNQFSDVLDSELIAILNKLPQAGGAARPAGPQAYPFEVASGAGANGMVVRLKHETGTATFNLRRPDGSLIRPQDADNVNIAYATNPDVPESLYLLKTAANGTWHAEFDDAGLGNWTVMAFAPTATFALSVTPTTDQTIPVGGTLPVTWAYEGLPDVSTIRIYLDTDTDVGGGVLVGDAPSLTPTSTSVVLAGVTKGDYRVCAEVLAAGQVPAYAFAPGVVHLTSDDTTPPSAVSDLMATTPSTSTIQLSWTAPGNDGAVGRALRYDIRASNAEITAENWGSAAVLPNPPAPATAGTPESMTVRNLPPATQYFFALKSSDEGLNVSPLSNVASATTLSGPAISGVAPGGGPAAGGTQVTIAGSNFATSGTVTVTLGGTPATGVTLVSATQITCAAPPGTHGWADAAVTNPDSLEAKALDAYLYVGAPTVTAITPSHGPSGGGTQVTITGANFVPNSTTTITFDYLPANLVTVASATEIRCIVPPHYQGPVTVRIANPYGQSGTFADAYTYDAPPYINSVSPGSGTTLGGTSVTITGTGFVGTGTVSVEFGSALAANVVVRGATQITCSTPAHAQGIVSARVTNADGQWDELSEAYNYLMIPSVASVAASAGRMGGGTYVTITGANFLTSGTTTVVFGGETASNVVVMDGTGLTCCTPPHVAGLVDVTVTSPNGLSGSLSDAYTYTGWEGDIAPRPALGNEALDAGDLSQQRRFVAGLDTPTPGPEFQRVDIAPRGGLGDSDLTASDLSQQRRYVAGLDPWTGAGGPTQFAGLGGPAQPVGQPEE